MTQKFFKGDLVEVGNMPPNMRHFMGNCKAIVLYTYAERCGPGKNSEKSYCLHIIKDRNDHAWYYEDQLTLVEPERFDLLPKSHIDRKVWDAIQERKKAA